MAQAIDGNPGDVVPGGGAGSPYRAAWWICPGRPDVSAGRRILAPSAADVLRKSVPVVGPGVVFVVLGHSPRDVRYKAVFHLVTNPYVSERPDDNRQGGMPPRRPETARGIPQAFPRRLLAKWAGEPMLQDVKRKEICSFEKT